MPAADSAPRTWPTVVSRSRAISSSAAARCSSSPSVSRAARCSCSARLEPLRPDARAPPRSAPSVAAAAAAPSARRAWSASAAATSRLAVDQLGRDLWRPSASEAGQRRRRALPAARSISCRALRGRDALAGGRERLGRGAARAPARGRRGRPAAAGLPVHLLAVERPGAGLGDRALEPFVDLRQFALRARVCSSPRSRSSRVERLAPRREIRRGAPVALRSGPRRARSPIRAPATISRARSRAPTASADSSRACASAASARASRAAASASRSRRSSRVAPTRRRPSTSRSWRARQERCALAAQRLGLLLVARGARRLPLQRGDVALDLRDDVGETQQVPARLLELRLGQPLASACTA